MIRSRCARLLTLLLVPALLVAACGGGGDDDADGGSGGTADIGEVPEADPGSDLAAECPVDALDSAEGPVEITFWHSMTVELGETLQDLVDEYNASQDRVRVELQFQGSYTESLDKYLTALRGGTRPTIVQLEETALQIGIDAESFVPVQACVDASDYSFDDHIDRVVAAYTVDGVLHPMPFNTSNPVLYANMAILREAGVEELPTTVAEMREAAQAVVDSGAAPNGVTFTTSAWLIEQWFGLAGEPFVDGDNGRGSRATEVLLDGELGQEIFEFMGSMVDDGLAVNVGNGDNQEHLLALATGQAAMTINTSAALRSVKTAAQDFPGVEVAIGPLPSVGEREGGVLVGGAALWLDADTSDEERAAAWDLLTWLSEPEQQARWHASTGYVPIRQSAIELPEVAELWAAEPEFRIAYDQLVEGTENVGSAGPVIGNHAQVRQDAVVPALERMWIEGMSPSEAVERATSDANRIIADYSDRLG
ncbi:ABC transporter substrate-binding protein [Actinomarinicola tropica]|uniref:Extracellular solute-binding protein n=1 Tax=Actinomarinicola tropica TaxID=2789776 RepID=A0A5Q2RJJ5_9ACTN|nr:ABC transporter substrate-binding protein [Actinomarinicola tropica]QGG94731.1 extracellular solute-binding protein [Actinomarinicola tropica]